MECSVAPAQADGIANWAKMVMGSSEMIDHDAIAKLRSHMGETE